MNLGVIPEQGGSLTTLAKSGQERRFINSYLARYALSFEQVYYFSYASENFGLPRGVHLISNPGFHRWLYSLSLPLVHSKTIRKCSVLRVMQAYGSIPAIIAKWLFGIPFILTYGYDYLSFAQLNGKSLRGIGFFLRSIAGIKLADRVIVTTPTINHSLKKWIRDEKMLLVPNGVETEQFKPIIGHKRDSTATLLFVGRLSSQKNLDVLLAAVSLIKHLDFKLIFVGDGPEKHNLIDLARSNGVHLELFGVISHDALPQLFNSATIFILPSKIEGHSKVLLEAMSCGLPCIGSNVEGIRDVIQHEKTGLLCRPDPQDLAQAIQRLLTDQEFAIRLGQAAREYVITEFEQSTQLAKEISVLTKLAKNHAKP